MTSLTTKPMTKSPQQPNMNISQQLSPQKTTTKITTMTTTTTTFGRRSGERPVVVGIEDASKGGTEANGLAGCGQARKDGTD